jgi:hypothetical protein
MSLESAVSGADVWWIAPTYKMAGQVWRDFKRASVTLYGAINQADRRIDYPIAHRPDDSYKAGSLTIRSAHQPDMLRGAGLDLVVLDEAAYMTAETWHDVIRPMLADESGGAYLLSTPCGRNWFYDLYQLGQDKTQTDWVSFQRSIHDNPHIPKKEIDSIRMNTSDRVFRAEYLAEFIDDGGVVFRGVREAASAPPFVAPEDGRRYVGGIDWGRNKDYTVITLIDEETRCVVAVERFNKVGWEIQRGRIQELCERWQPVVLWAEENSIGAVNIEALQAEGLPVRAFKMTAVSKAPLIEALALALERRELAILPDEAPNGAAMIHELVAYTMTQQPGGGARYSAPAGAHDDCVISLALAWHGVRFGGASLSFG